MGMIKWKGRWYSISTFPLLILGAILIPLTIAAARFIVTLLR